MVAPHAFTAFILFFATARVAVHVPLNSHPDATVNTGSGPEPAPSSRSPSVANSRVDVNTSYGTACNGPAMAAKPASTSNRVDSHSAFETVIEHGTLPLLVKLLTTMEKEGRAPHQEEGVLTAVLNILTALSESIELSERGDVSSLVQPMILMMDSMPSDEDIIDAMTAICTGESGCLREALMRSKVHTRLVRMLRAGSGAVVPQAVLSTHALVDETSSQAMDMMKAQALPPLAAVLTSSEYGVMTPGLAAEAISICIDAQHAVSQAETRHLLVLELRVVPSLIWLVQEGDAETNGYAIRLLSKLSPGNATMKDTLVELGVVSPILRVLTKKKVPPHIQEAAVRVFHHLAKGDDVEAVQTPRREGQKVSEFLMTLTEGQNEGRRQALIKKGVVDVLLTILQTGRLVCKQEAVGALAGLTVIGNETCDLLVKKGLPALLALLDTGTGSCRAVAAKVVYNLVKASESRQNILAGYGAIGPLANMVKAPTYDRTALQALVAFMSFNHKHTRTIIATGMLAAVVEILDRRNVLDPGSIVQAGRFLHRLCACSRRAVIENHHGLLELPNVLPVLMRRAEEGQLESQESLKLLSNSSEAVKNKLTDLGILALLVEKLKFSEPIIKGFAAKLVSLLVSEGHDEEAFISSGQKQVAQLAVGAFKPGARERMHREQKRQEAQKSEEDALTAMASKTSNLKKGDKDVLPHKPSGWKWRMKVEEMCSKKAAVAPAVISVPSDHEARPSVQLSMDHRRELLLESGALPLMVSMAGDEGLPDEIKVAVLQALISVASGTDMCKRAMLKLGLMGPILDCLSHQHIAQAQAVQLVGEMMLGNEARTAELLHLGVMALLVSVLRRGDFESQAAAAQTLGMLAENSAARRAKIIEAGALGGLMHIIKQADPDGRGIQSKSMACVAIDVLISSSSVLLEDMLEMGLMPHLLDLLQWSKGHAKGHAMHVLECILSNLGLTEQQKETCVKQDVLSKLNTLMSLGSEKDRGVAMRVSLAVLEKSSTSSTVRVNQQRVTKAVEDGMLEAAFKVISGAWEDPETMELGLRLVNKLVASVEEHKDHFVKMEGVELLVSLGRSEDTTVESLEEVTLVMFHISNGSEARKDTLMNFGAIEVLLKVVETGSDTVKGWAATTLSNIAYGSEARKEKIESLDGIGVLVGLMDSGQGDAKFRAVSAINNLASGSEKRKAQIMDADVLAALIACLSQGNEVTRERAVSAISNLCLGSDMRKDTFMHTRILGPVMT
ncbi:hypothetical protein CYMTET_15001, partial [Cymbomonas tetramitiformis]